MSVCVRSFHILYYSSLEQNNVSFMSNIKINKMTLQFICCSCHLTTQTTSATTQISKTKTFQKHDMTEKTKMFQL